jgi:hypothetical protein
MSSLTCGLAFIVEKKDGMLHRAMVAGVLKVEIMVAHSATHFLVLVVQTSIAFMVMFLVFDIPQLGSLPLAYALVLLNGVAGMALGKYIHMRRTPEGSPHMRRAPEVLAIMRMHMRTHIYTLLVPFLRFCGSYGLQRREERHVARHWRHFALFLGFRYDFEIYALIFENRPLTNDAFSTI